MSVVNAAIGMADGTALGNDLGTLTNQSSQQLMQLAAVAQNVVPNSGLASSLSSQASLTGMGSALANNGTFNQLS